MSTNSNSISSIASFCRRLNCFKGWPEQKRQAPLPLPSLKNKPIAQAFVAHPSTGPGNIFKERMSDNKYAFNQVRNEQRQVFRGQNSDLNFAREEAKDIKDMKEKHDLMDKMAIMEAQTTEKKK